MAASITPHLQEKSTRSSPLIFSGFSSAPEAVAILQTHLILLGQQRNAFIFWIPPAFDCAPLDHNIRVMLKSHRKNMEKIILAAT